MISNVRDKKDDDNDTVTIVCLRTMVTVREDGEGKSYGLVNGHGHLPAGQGCNSRHQ